MSVEMARTAEFNTAGERLRQLSVYLSGELLQSNAFRQRRVVPHGDFNLSDVAVEVFGAVVERGHELTQWGQRHVEGSTNRFRCDPPHWFAHHTTTVQQTVSTNS